MNCHLCSRPLRAVSNTSNGKQIVHTFCLDCCLDSPLVEPRHLLVEFIKALEPGKVYVARGESELTGLTAPVDEDLEPVLNALYGLYSPADPQATHGALTNTEASTLIVWVKSVERRLGQLEHIGKSTSRTRGPA